MKIENDSRVLQNRRRGSVNNGSLYKMFNSDFFGMELLMYYLDIKTECGILDTLVNLIYKKYIHQSLFYLPQLCIMFNYKTYTDSLECYILDRCVNQMKFSLQVTWLINSYVEDNLTKKDDFESLIQKIEETLVNGNRGTKLQYIQYDNSHKGRTTANSTDNNDIFQASLNKEIKLKYFDKSIKFYQKLKAMCEDLKNYPREPTKTMKTTRKMKLKEYVNSFNDKFIKQREKNAEYLHSNLLFYGIILPFDDYFTTDDNDNSLIVRFIPEQSFCFSTKARVPTKLCAECIRVNECSKWDELYSKTNKDQNESFVLQIEESIKPMRYSDSTKKDKKENADCLKAFYEQINKAMNEETKPKEDDFVIVPSHSYKEELKGVFGKPLNELQEEIKKTSHFRNFTTYSIKNFIAKANDDLRQELLSMQMIKLFHEIFKQANIPLKLHPYEILITSSSSGLLEFLHNTNSIDGIKKSMSAESKYNLNFFYRNYFGDEFDQSQRNFCESLAAYSLICYYLQIKDRHNGNILIDMYGNIIHIDFGFILGISPGNLNFESAPFKLTLEYLSIMDGDQSDTFSYFKSLMVRGMIESKKHVESFVKIVEIMSNGATMPCFDNKDLKQVIQKFRERFFELNNDSEFTKIVEDLIYKSQDNFWTNKYDYFQKVTNGIIP